ncbi:hypothetical protein [Dactylosporangium sp. NPDC050588]|uniref:hypothetical protein n=1 Tax=Dactylosporangium sp. NPDC050588 TaxID=3157211 RepID=UPI0033DA7CAC
MFRWLRSGWLTIWGARPFTVRTPMSVTAAVAALDADRATRWTALGLSSRGAGFRHVTGSVTADGVRLTSRRPGWNNLFSPVLQARFTPLPDGCELTGSFTAPEPARAFTLAWPALTILWSMCALGASGSLVPVAAGFGMAALGIVMATTSALAGRRDEQHLRSWVNHRLRGAA